ncbi:MAG: hypothetical protein SGILL_000300 [Bacillariaceae sp.]
MADCSAAGTTIDRAARAVLGASENAAAASASKHVSALLGHAAAMPGTSAMPMPAMNPDHLVLPGATVAVPPRMATAAPPSHAQAEASSVHNQSAAAAAMDQAWKNSISMGNAPPTAMMISPQYQQQHMIQQQQQQQQHMYHQQQHMQFQMQQQHMTMMLQQQQQQQMHQQRSVQIARQNASKESNQKQQQRHHQSQSPLEDWHQGLEAELEQELLGHDGIVEGASMEQLAAAWAQAEAQIDLEADNVTVGDTTNADGMVRGAGIEELAAAWAEAENEYDHVLLDSQVPSDYLQEEDYANMWQGSDLQSELDHVVRPYQFVNTIPPQDKIANANAASPNYMEEGMKHFQEGNLKEAIVSFEMELQQRDLDNASAWRMLGRCHAENDQDPEAIKCLEAAVDRDPYSPDSLLALGVSYVNELNHERALENMKAWFTHNPKYAGMELPDVNQEEDIYGAASASPRDSAFNEVRRMLEAALEFDPSDAADIHEALGVIYNVIKDFDAATESFRNALEIRPDDYQLWNKLGATLANGGHSDQALPAYHQALQIKPKYARAWLNMAISHSNLQDHDEAARCYLQTLALSPNAAHCWTYLRMALSSRERWDLLPLVFARDLAGFQKHFDFVMY